MEDMKSNKNIEELYKELSEEKDLKKLVEKCQKIPIDELILLKLCCKERIENCAIYKMVYTPVSIMLSVFLQVVQEFDWVKNSGMYHEVALIAYLVIWFGVGAVILDHYKNKERSQKILDAIEEAEKYGKLMKNPE